MSLVMSLIDLDCVCGSDFKERKDEKKSAFPTELTQAPSPVANFG